MNSPTITISPYLRLSLAGFDIVLKNHGTKFRLTLKRGEEIVATGSACRSHRLTKDEALRRIQLNQFGQTSDMFSLVTRFADIAESLTASKEVV